MKSAIVTGASRGIGLAITQILLGLGYQVFGIARSFDKGQPAHPNFMGIQCDITRIEEIKSTLQFIKNKTTDIHILVNNAGVGAFGPHEQLSPEKILAMVNTNLSAPMILTALVLRDLKKSRGFVIQISSITAKKISTHGCAYSATKAGLAHFSDSLFEEVRKSGVRVVTLYPDMTATAFFDELDFTYEEAPDTHVLPESVAEAFKFILQQPEGTTITELTIRPQRNQIRRK